MFLSSKKVTCVTFIGLGRQQSQDVVQPEPHHRCTCFQVSTMDLNDSRDSDKTLQSLDI